MSYKQTVQDIKDFISLETATIERLISKQLETMPDMQKAELRGYVDAYKNIADIIKENEKKK